MKGADGFERSLKEALGSYEVPYNSADWAQLERRLDAGRVSTRHTSAGLIALLLGGSIAVSTTVWYLMNEDPNSGASNEIAMVNDVNDDAGRNDTDGASFAAGSADTIAEETTVTEGSALIENDAVAEVKPVRTAAKERSADRTTTRKATASTELASTEKTNVKEEASSGSKSIAIKPSVTEGCPGTTVEFKVENMPDEGIHLWNFGDGSFSNKPDPTHTFSKAGTFEVMLSHSSVGGGNILNKPASDRIVIHEAPEASFHFRKDEEENRVPSVQFENRSIGGNQYHWDFGDGSSTAIAHPNHVFKKKGTYQVTLTTTNAKGCIDRTDRTIVIDKDYNLLAPSTFSPDGNGFEDTFIPEALKTLGAGFHMSIFDPVTGAILYETTDPQRPWNGRINNKGELCSAGEYVWLVEMKDGELLGGTYTGNVSLLR